MSVDYNSLSYHQKFWRAVRIALITLAVVLAVGLPAIWCWEQSVLQRQALREAKNILDNLEFMSIEYLGNGEQISDSRRPNGLSRQAEAEVLSFSGAEGEIRQVAWLRAGTDQSVCGLIYQTAGCQIQYRRDKAADDGVWEVYRCVHQYKQ